MLTLLLCWLSTDRQCYSCAHSPLWEVVVAATDLVLAIPTAISAARRAGRFTMVSVLSCAVILLDLQFELCWTIVGADNTWKTRWAEWQKDIMLVHTLDTHSIPEVTSSCFEPLLRCCASEGIW